MKFSQSYAEVLRGRIKDRVVIEDRGHTTPCWISTRAAAGSGGSYTKIGVRASTGRYQSWYTHRLSYTLFVGPIPVGKIVDHRCDQPKCCNPGHLAAVTQRENLLRSDGVSAKQLAQDSCLRGHRFDEANTYVDRRGRRHCRPCKRIRRGSAGHPPPDLTAGEVARAELKPKRRP